MYFLDLAHPEFSGVSKIENSVSTMVIILSCIKMLLQGSMLIKAKLAYCYKHLCSQSHLILTNTLEGKCDEPVGMRALELDCLNSCLCLSTTSCATLAKSLNLSMPQFPHLENGYDW